MIANDNVFFFAFHLKVVLFDFMIWPHYLMCMLQYITLMTCIFKWTEILL